MRELFAGGSTLVAFPTWLFPFEVAGIIVFAISGILEARKRGLDIVGTYAVALVTAFGGGTLRDLCIGRRPLFWIEHDWYLALIALITVIAVVGRLNSSPRWVIRLYEVTDAFGLGLFSVVGVAYAFGAGCGVLAALVLGVITAITGGVLRDVLCNEIPYVFRKTELCATCALLGGAVYWLLLYSFGLPTLALILGTAVVVMLRLLSVWYGVRLPVD